MQKFSSLSKNQQLTISLAFGALVVSILAMISSVYFPFFYTRDGLVFRLVEVKTGSSQSEKPVIEDLVVAKLLLLNTGNRPATFLAGRIYIYSADGRPSYSLNVTTAAKGHQEPFLLPTNESKLIEVFMSASAVTGIGEVVKKTLAPGIANYGNEKAPFQAGILISAVDSKGSVHETHSGVQFQIGVRGAYVSSIGPAASGKYSLVKVY